MGILLFVLFLPCLGTHLSHGANTISTNRSLTINQTIVSIGGNFELGFYKPGKSSNYYICIWYHKVSKKTIVWVANRQQPISDHYSSELKIINGNLILVNGSQATIWSTNLTPTASKSVVAVLEDNGNLVLKDKSSSSSTEPLWQSFYHPAHTLLPGSKLGYNKHTKTHQRLTSWKNSEDPAEGFFSVSLDANSGQFLMLWNGTQQYWTSGPWEGQSFSLIPEMRRKYIYNFSYTDNANWSYFTYSVNDPSIISTFILEASGQAKQLTWFETNKQWMLFWSQPKQQCEVYAYCGSFGICNNVIQPSCNCMRSFRPKFPDDWDLNDYSGGCVRKSELKCKNANSTNQKEDMFWQYSNVVLPVNPLSVNAGNAVECKSHCLSNCSCTAYAFESQKCSIWTVELVNLQQLSGNDGSGKTLYLKLDAFELSSGNDKKQITIDIVVVSVGGVGIFCLILFVIWRRKRFSGKTEVVEGFLVAFTYKDLKNATKNFSKKLGGGGFGFVFKGTLSDSSFIAVKKLDSIGQGEKQFRTEVRTIGTIQHVNLVRLRGFCSENNKKLLVYDFMPNGSLNSHLFCKDGNVVDWKTRYQIALGTARGLAYLHEECCDCIIHCDIKPENILLDANFCPKVADFGLAKLMGHEFSRVLTTMRGTRGYLAPEWMSGVAITAKADVYSYGMMIFEFVSGRRNSEQFIDRKVKYFPLCVANAIMEGSDLISLLDPRLEGKVDEEELKRICKTACWCIQENENHRPTMSEVVQFLEVAVGVNPPPFPRYLQDFLDDDEHIVFFPKSSSNPSSESPSHQSSKSPSRFC